MKIGYTRVSTEGQNHGLQLAVLKKAKRKRIFEDACQSNEAGQMASIKMLAVGDALSSFGA